MRRTGKLLAAAGVILLASFAPLTVFGEVTEHGLTVEAVRSAYDNVAISRVTNYVNVRTEPRIGSEVVGKIYNNCAASILATVEGEDGEWYQIQSGTVSGYIKAQYFYTGEAAETIAREVGTVYIKVSADHLRLRKEASLESEILTLLSQDEEYIEIGSEGDFIQVQVDADLTGYVHRDYVQERVDFKQAVSLEEEQKQKEEAERLKKEADDAIAEVEKLKAENGQSQENEGTQSADSGQTDTGTGESTTDGQADAGSSESTADAQTGTGGTTGIITVNPDGSQTDSQDTGTAEEDSEQADSLAEGQQNGPAGSDSKQTTDSGTDSEQNASSSQNTGTEAYGPGYEGNQSSGSAADSGKTTAASGDSALAAATRTAIVAYAKQFVGNPYVYGGTSLTDGADCSGFTMKIFEHFGISTGRSSRDQAANGKEISVSAVQPGDLVFYASGSTINHVALYIGGGQIIHASTERTGIKISSMNYRTPCKAVSFLD